MLQETPSLIDQAQKIVNVLGWPTLLALVWRISARYSRLETTVDEIKNNHLAHVDEDLKLIKEVLLKK